MIMQWLLKYWFCKTWIFYMNIGVGFKTIVVCVNCMIVCGSV